MKRIYFFLALGAGIAGGLWYLYDMGYLDVDSVWQNLLSYWSLAMDKTTALTSNDPFEIAVGLIAGFEGFSAKAYPDADGYSIGYGHFVTPSDPYDSDSVISQDEAHTLLEQDARGAQSCVDSAVTFALTPAEFAALYSFTYNVGCGAFKSSTLLKKVNAGDLAGAAAEFPKWNLSGGEVMQSLVNRRASEEQEFQS